MHGLTLFCTKEVHFRIIDMTEHFHLDFSCIPLSPNICMTIEFPSLALKPKVELKSMVSITHPTCLLKCHVDQFKL